MSISVIAFDLFGTVYDLSAVHRNEVKAYVAQVHKSEWEPLVLPESWAKLRAFEDAKPGLERLRSRYTVVTCSNAPLRFQVLLNKRNGLVWDAIIPLEAARVYKPNPKAYVQICELTGATPDQVMMVTANKTFGDIEASFGLGMTPRLIRGDGVKTLLDLAEQMGC